MHNFARMISNFDFGIVDNFMTTVAQTSSLCSLGTDTMHSENLHTEYAETFRGYRYMKLFSDGGITPAGECWVSPTNIFLRVWESPAGVHLKKQGFRLQDNGKQIGASQDRILICPRQKD